MLITERDRLHEDVMSIAELTGFNRASLIPILSEVKRKYRGVDSYVVGERVDRDDGTYYYEF